VALSLGRQMDTWLAAQRIESSTRAGYVNAIRFWRTAVVDGQVLGDKLLRAVKHSDLLRALASHPSLSGKTVNNCVEWWMFTRVRQSEAARPRWGSAGLASGYMQIGEAIVRGMENASTKSPASCAAQLGHSIEMLMRLCAKWIRGEQDQRELQQLEARLAGPGSAPTPT
jgi:hypothetical protein